GTPKKSCTMPALSACTAISLTYCKTWTNWGFCFDPPGLIRKFTRNRKIYPNEKSAFKIVYMAIQEASGKWTMPIHHWTTGAQPLRDALRRPHARLNQQMTNPAWADTKVQH